MELGLKIVCLFLVFLILFYSDFVARFSLLVLICFWVAWDHVFEGGEGLFIACLVVTRIVDLSIEDLVQRLRSHHRGLKLETVSFPLIDA